MFWIILGIIILLVMIVNPYLGCATILIAGFVVGIIVFKFSFLSFLGHLLRFFVQLVRAAFFWTKEMIHLLWMWLKAKRIENLEEFLSMAVAVF